MNNFTTNAYEMKREILNFSKKVSKGRYYSAFKCKKNNTNAKK